MSERVKKEYLTVTGVLDIILGVGLLLCVAAFALILNDMPEPDGREDTISQSLFTLLAVIVFLSFPTIGTIGLVLGVSELRIRRKEGAYYRRGLKMVFGFSGAKTFFCIYLIVFCFTGTLRLPDLLWGILPFMILAVSAGFGFAAFAGSGKAIIIHSELFCEKALYEPQEYSGFANIPILEKLDLLEDLQDKRRFGEISEREFLRRKANILNDRGNPR